MPTFPALHAAIIDLDGTLVDTLGDFEEALSRTLTDAGLPAPTRSLVERSVGKGSEHLIRTVLAHQLSQQAGPVDAHAAAPATVDALYPQAWQRYQQHYLQINGTFSRVYDGVEEGLAALQARGLRLACLTNKPLEFAQPLLQKKGLAGYFSHVFGGDSFQRKKPDPLPLQETCRALGTATAHTLMVGDSSNDAQAAHAAGCPLVLMTYGYNHGEPIRQTPALAWLDSLAEVSALLV